MNTKTYKTFYESVIDLVRKSYSTVLFDDAFTDNPKLKPLVKKQILAGVDLFAKLAPVKAYKLIGSSLTRQYKNDADLDINILFDVPDDQVEIIKPKLYDLLREINGRTVRGTDHPINYYVIVDPKQHEAALANADAVFDIDSNKWEKMPPPPHEVDVEPFMDLFDQTIQKFDLLKNKFQRDLIDYKIFKDMSSEAAVNLHDRVKKKLQALEDDINALIDAEDDVMTKRRAVFARDLTRDELEMYGTHNRLPENILYKILERYHYIDLTHHVKKVIGDDRKLTEFEADRL